MLKEVKELREELKTSAQGGTKAGYIANTFQEGLIPQEYFADAIKGFAVREGLASKMACSRDREKLRLKFMRAFFGSAMPHDPIGEFVMSQLVTADSSVASKEKMTDLKQYTDALTSRTGTNNAHTDHNRRHHYPGSNRVEALYLTMINTLDDLRTFALRWAQHCKRVLEMQDPEAVVDDPLFAVGAECFMDGVSGEQQERCVMYVRMMARYVSELLNYALALIRAPEAGVAPSKVFTERSGVHHWQQVRDKLRLIFEHIFALRRTYRVRHEGLLAVLAFLESCSKKSWEVPRFDKTSLYAPTVNPKLEAFANKFGTKDDPAVLASLLTTRMAAMEKKNEALEKQLAAAKASTASPDGYDALVSKVANLGVSLTTVQSSVGNLKRDGGGGGGGKGKPKGARGAKGGKGDKDKKKDGGGVDAAAADGAAAAAAAAEEKEEE